MATLGVLYPGRVLLGVGTGESMRTVPIRGIDWPDSRGRFARLKEAVGLMQSLWTEETVSHDRDYLRFLGQFSSLVLPKLRAQFARGAREETYVRRIRVL